MEGIGLTCGRKVKNLTFPTDSVNLHMSSILPIILYMNLLLCDNLEVFITSSTRLLSAMLSLGLGYSYNIAIAVPSLIFIIIAAVNSQDR